MITLSLFAFQARDWRLPMTAAIDAYRALNTMVRKLEIEKLVLDDMGQLAANCPRCYGPPVGATNTQEPDIVVCSDANFQQRRHDTASVPIPGYNPPIPELFIPPQEVQVMADELQKLNLGPNVNEDEEVVSTGHLFHNFSPNLLMLLIQMYLVSILAPNRTQQPMIYAVRRIGEGTFKRG